MDRFAEANRIRLHYLDHGGSEPVLVLLPGLTANAHCFDGLVQAGLSPRFRVLALDLRGRGLSDKPETGYGMPDHAADVVGLLDSLGIERAVIGGHSFGGLVTLYLASRFPNRVAKAILLDSSVMIVNPSSRELIKPSVARLGKTFSTWEDYIAEIKQAPYYAGWWDPAIESYYRADVDENPDGSVKPRSNPEHILEAIDRAGAEDWLAHAAAIRQPVLLLRAPEGFGLPGAAPIVPVEHAKSTAQALSDCRSVVVPGNHMTMLYGDGAREIVERVIQFIDDDRDIHPWRG